MRFSSYSRKGETLFGLLLLLTILGMLAALMFPALGKAREAQKRIRCGNNMHQIGIAVHNHIASANGVMPADAGKNGGSWCVHLLPYLPNLKKGDQQYEPTFYSPTRRMPQLYNKQPKTDYAGNAGSGDDPTQLKNADGVVSPGLKIQDIANADGTSNTLLASLKYVRTTDYQSGKGKGDDGDCWKGGTIDTLRSSHGEKRPPIQDADKDYERGFGAPTEKRMNILMCDGSVRRWNYDGEGFGSLCSRNDMKFPKFD